MNLINKPLRVVHFPQVPCKPFIVTVANELEANLILNTLAQQHLFMFENNIIPDNSNIIMVEMFEDGEWCDYWNDDESMDFDEFAETYFKQDLEALKERYPNNSFNG